MQLYQDLLVKYSPVKLADWLNQNFSNNIPTSLNNTENVKAAGELLSVLTGQYSYLCSLLSYAKIYVRDAKRHLSKEEYEDMVDRKECIQNMVDTIKMQYQCISRMITVWTEMQRELQMLGVK